MVLNFEFRFFAVSNYKLLQDIITKGAPKFGEAGVKYGARIVQAIEEQLKATKSGDLRKMAESVRNDAKISKDGADAVKKNPIIYYLGKYFAPEQYEMLAKAMERHKAGAMEENELLRVFHQIVKSAVMDHFFEGDLTIDGNSA